MAPKINEIYGWKSAEKGRAVVVLRRAIPGKDKISFNAGKREYWMVTLLGDDFNTELGDFRGQQRIAHRDHLKKIWE